MNVHDLHFFEDYLKLLSQPLAAMHEESYENAVNALKLGGVYMCRQG
jgi:hypothetical protein